MVDKSVLLQLVALMLPAIGIYMQIVYSDEKPQEFDCVEQGSYHQGRLSVLFLLVAGLLLLTDLMIGEIVSGLVSEFVPSLGSNLISLLNSVSWIGPLAGGLWVVKSILIRPKYQIEYAFLIPLLFLTPILVRKPVDGFILYLLGGGLAMFAGMVAFEKGGRQTKQPIYWGLFEAYNHLAGTFDPDYSRGNRLLEIPESEEIHFPDKSNYVIIPKNKISSSRTGEEVFEIDGEEFKIEYKGSTNEDRTSNPNLISDLVQSVKNRFWTLLEFF